MDLETFKIPLTFNNSKNSTDYRLDYIFLTSFEKNTEFGNILSLSINRYY